MYDPEFRPYLTPTFFIDYDNPEVAAFADEHTAGLTDPLEKAVNLFQSVRDDFRYDPYRIPLKPENFKASLVLDQGYGFCITKAVYLADHGSFADLPYKKIMQTWAKHYTSILAGQLAAASSGVFDTFEKDS